MNINRLCKRIVAATKPLLAPNGKPSNLNVVQWEQVRTKEFKKWFGDWEKNPQSASKIVDSNGEPLICYHGTKADFKKFVVQKDPKNGRASGDGFYFSSRQHEANKYAGGGSVLPVFLKAVDPYLGNPFKLKEPQKSLILDGEGRFDLVVQKAGFDAITDDFLNQIVVFKPNQIKSAIGNKGTFDSSDNITSSLRNSMTRNDFKIKTRVASAFANHIKHRILANVYSVGSPVAIYWGDNDKGEPEFYAGVVDSIDGPTLTVNMNFGEVEILGKEDAGSIVLLSKPIASKSVLTKAQVAKVRLKKVGAKQPDNLVTPELIAKQHKGTIVADEQGNEYLVIGARHDYVQVAPIIKGKALVDSDNLLTYHLDPHTASGYPNREHGKLFLLKGRDYYAEQEALKPKKSVEEVFPGITLEEAAAVIKRFKSKWDEYSKFAESLTRNNFTYCTSLINQGYISADNAQKILDDAKKLWHPEGFKIVTKNTVKEIQFEIDDANKKLNTDVFRQTTPKFISWLEQFSGMSTRDNFQSPVIAARKYEEAATNAGFDIRWDIIDDPNTPVTKQYQGLIERDGKELARIQILTGGDSTVYAGDSGKEILTYERDGKSIKFLLDPTMTATYDLVFEALAGSGLKASPELPDKTDSGFWKKVFKAVMDKNKEDGTGVHPVTVMHNGDYYDFVGAVGPIPFFKKQIKQGVTVHRVFNAPINEFSTKLVTQIQYISVGSAKGDLVLIQNPDRAGTSEINNWRKQGFDI